MPAEGDERREDEWRGIAYCVNENSGRSLVDSQWSPPLHHPFFFLTASNCLSIPELSVPWIFISFDAFRRLYRPLCVCIDIFGGERVQISKDSAEDKKGDKKFSFLLSLSLSGQIRIPYLPGYVVRNNSILLSREEMKLSTDRSMPIRMRDAFNLAEQIAKIRREICVVTYKICWRFIKKSRANIEHRLKSSDVGENCCVNECETSIVFTTTSFVFVTRSLF